MNNETQNREQELENCLINESYNRYPLTENGHPMQTSEQGMILDFYKKERIAFIDGVKSDAAKQYHQPETKAVDLETLRLEFRKSWNLACEDRTNPNINLWDKVFNEFKHCLSTPLKALSEGEIDFYEMEQSFKKWGMETHDSYHPTLIFNFFKNYISNKANIFKILQSIQSNQQEEIERLKKEAVELNKALDYERKNTYNASTQNAKLMAKISDLQGKMERGLNELDYDLPENMPLYRDSGLWQLRSDDMNETILHQFVNEKFIDFINRCKQWNREENLQP